MKKITLTLVLLYSSAALFAALRLPRIFSDHMVLQRDRAIPVWGWAEPNEKITVQLNKQSQSTTADAGGRWQLRLAPESAGGPYQLIVNGKERLVVEDVLIGDVWICSGQSNMEWTVSQSKDPQATIAAAQNTQIRHFKVPHAIAAAPVADVTGGSWQPATSEFVGEFTGVGYFFANALYQRLKIPIGLLNTSWGGTHVETWTSRSAFENSPEFREMIAGMPRLNLDSIAQIKSEAIKKRIAELQGNPPGNPAQTATWSAPGFDDSRWPKMQAPGLWEQQALGDLDGEVWLRKTFDLKPEDSGKSAQLSLAMVDDNDETYVNGVKVGATVGYNLPRRYTIPAGVLQAGANTIAVKVTDTGGGGGIWGAAADLQIVLDGRPQSLSGTWPYQVASVMEGNAGVGPNSFPTLLFNGMLHPLLPYAISGVIWYQGESNADRAYQYRKAFPLMIQDWRKQWNQGDFPFYFVQLSSYNADNGNSALGSTWAELREAQTLTLSLPNTGMAVTTDVGNPTDIHPRNKQSVGARLAAIALSKHYGKSMVCQGPVYQSMRKEGSKLILSFSQAVNGLWTDDKYGYLKGFEIAGADQQFKYAKAWIEGDKVVVFREGVNDPVAVRFGWADDASENNLYNKERFPAQPFRTDNWKGITEDKKFKINP